MYAVVFLRVLGEHAVQRGASDAYAQNPKQRNDLSGGVDLRHNDSPASL